MAFFILDIMLTLIFNCYTCLPSGTCTWSLSTPALTTPDRISTQTDKSKLLHGLQLHIEPTLDWPMACSAAHNFDGNAILQSIIAFPVTFIDETSIQPGTKGRTCWFCH